MVEGLLALAILGLTFLPIFGTYTSATLGTHQVVNTTRALELASSRLELLAGLPFAHVSALPARATMDPAELGRPFEGEVERLDAVPGELVRITVRIRWKLNDRLSEKVELATLIANPRAR